MLPPWLGLLLLLLVAGLILCAITVLAMARTLLRPPRMSDAKAVYLLARLSPADLGLEFAPHTFTVRDHQTGGCIQIAAWWIARPAGAVGGSTVILIHGYGDAKVGSIAWAPMLHALGWNVLAIDLRAHGESGGRHTTAGYFERHDLSQVIDELLATHPDQARRLVLFGVSLGAAVALAAAAMRNEIAGLILDSPYADYREAVAVHGNIMGAPGGPLRDMAISLAERMSGADFSAVRPVDLVGQARCPILIVQPVDDPFAPAGQQDALRRAVEARAPGLGRVTVRQVSGAGHVLAMAADPQAYQAAVAEFLAACESLR